MYYLKKLSQEAALDWATARLRSDQIRGKNNWVENLAISAVKPTNSAAEPEPSRRAKNAKCSGGPAVQACSYRAERLMSNHNQQTLVWHVHFSLRTCNSLIHEGNT